MFWIIIPSSLNQARYITMQRMKWGRIIKCHLVFSNLTFNKYTIWNPVIMKSSEFLVWDRLYTHSCVSGGGSRRWCMLFVLRIVNKTSTSHNTPHWLTDIIRRIGVLKSCSILHACSFNFNLIWILISSLNVFFGMCTDEW